MAPKKKATPVKKTSNLRKSTQSRAKKGIDAKVANENTPTPQIENPAEAFKIVSTDVQLGEGICNVRSLGGGRYEIINLNTVSQNAIGSVEMADLVKSVPERLASFDITKTQWDAAMLKCDVAVRITSK